MTETNDPTPAEHPQTPRIAFAEREVHLRQRAERGWSEDEDVSICLSEIDRINEQWRDFHADECIFWQHDGHCAHEANR